MEQPIVINGIWYHRLFMPCPVCVGMQEERPPSLYWEHLEDGGDMYIGSDATLYCDKCKMIHRWDNWKYSCLQRHGFVSMAKGHHIESSIFEFCVSSENLEYRGVGLPWMRELLYNIA